MPLYSFLSPLPEYFLNIVASAAGNLIKKRFWRRCFPVHLVKCFNILFYKEHLWWLFLSNRDISIYGSIQNSHLSILFTTIILNLPFLSGIKENFLVASENIVPVFYIFLHFLFTCFSIATEI